MLTTGTRLGPYEIQSTIGAGGMGEVYRARDTRLDRTVAIKVLPDTLAHDPQFRERFDREARAISQLTHPNICTMHDVGEQDGVAYLVLEHLDGETLAARLERTGALPLPETMTVAIQIAAALDTAHRAGIVHRDLKPANVFLTRRGGTGGMTAKLLDFGLAKAAPAGLSGGGVSVLPTTPGNLTAQGMILGTFQYMAPEQIEGLDADPRTDIFALGCVLYEMITGRKAFTGRTHASLISSILKDEPPPMRAALSTIPVALDRLIRVCLAKSPDDRWNSAHDVLLQLKAIQQDAEHGEPAAPQRAHVRPIPGLFTMIAASVVLAAIGAGLGWMLKPAPPEPGTRARFTTILPADQGFTRTGRHVIALSSDGTRLVYVANQRLFVRSLDDESMTPVRGTDLNPSSPFFSPDGEWIAFFANLQIRKVPLSGGPSIVVGEADNPWGASWDASGLLIGQGPRGILRLPSNGGARETLVARTQDDALLMSPQRLPGGNAILFTSVPTAPSGGTTRFENARAVVQRLDTKERKVVFEGGTDFRYIPSGHLVFVRQETLTAVTFDLATLTATGVPRSVVDGVQVSATTGVANFAVAANGTLVYVPAGTTEHGQLLWIDRQGRTTPVSAATRGFEDLSLSRDGRRVATTIFGRESDVWVHDIARNALTRITFNNEGRDPIFTPDGQRVIYSALRGGHTSLEWRPADGSGQPELLVELGPDAWHGGAGSVTPDGGAVLYDRGGDVWMLPLGGARKPVALIKTSFDENSPAVSPDGRWIAYVSNESGRDEVYVQPFPAGGGKWQISTAGGMDPLWAPSGQELFYRSDEAVMAVPVTISSTFAPGTPLKLFEGHYVQTGRDYGISPDGQRFMMIGLAAGLESARQIKWVLNWFDELRPRATR